MKTHVTKFYLGLSIAFLLMSFQGRAEYDYSVSSLGPHHVTQGYRILFELNCTRTDTGNASTLESLWTTLENLPPHATIDWADFGTYSNSFSATDGNKVYGSTFKFAIGVQTSPATPVGTYEITIRCKSGKTGVIRTEPYIIIVDPVQPLPVVTKTFCALPPLPDSLAFVSKMKSIGQHFCKDTADMQWDYDPTLVYYEISDYLKDSASWLPCMRTARFTNRDMDSAYDRRNGFGRGLGIIPARGLRPGYYIFSEGLYQDYIRTGDTLSRYAINLFATKANFSDYNFPLGWLLSTTTSRETAYNSRTFIKCNDMGEHQHDKRLSYYLDMALGHLDQWFYVHNSDYTRPFMVGLTLKTLIVYYNEVSPDPRIFPAVKMAADSLWKNFFVERNDSAAFKYTDVYTSTGDMTLEPDLNMLVGSAYAWIYHVTADTSYLHKADKIFDGMVRTIIQWDTKQYCQNFQWCFDYIKWRNNNPTDPSCSAARLALGIGEVSSATAFDILPNPANSQVSLKYTLPNAQYTHMEIYEITGKKLSVIRDANEAEGEHQISVDLSAFPRGIYFVRFNNEVKKLVLQ